MIDYGVIIRMTQNYEINNVFNKDQENQFVELHVTFCHKINFLSHTNLGDATRVYNLGETSTNS